MKTRAQRDLVLAEQLVSEVAGQPESVRKIYGGLCHSFPVLVRASGLCQAIAFSKDKAAVTGAQKSDRNQAYELLLQHVSRVLDIPGDPLDELRKADVVQYMFCTRRILSALTYFKRFAVSILKVATARDAEVEH